MTRIITIYIRRFIYNDLNCKMLESPKLQQQYVACQDNLKSFIYHVLFRNKDIVRQLDIIFPCQSIDYTVNYIYIFIRGQSS